MRPPLIFISIVLGLVVLLTGCQSSISIGRGYNQGFLQHGYGHGYGWHGYGHGYSHLGYGHGYGHHGYGNGSLR